MSDITINCPSCSQELEVPEELFSEIVECPSCNQAIQLPDPTPAPPATVPRRKNIVLRKQSQRPSSNVRTTPSRQSSAAPQQQSSGCIVKGGMVFGLIVVGILIFGIMSNCGGPSRSSSPPPRHKTQEEIRTERIEAGFSKWDGSHLGLTALIKKSMNDPKSYEHVETTYGEKGDYLVVKTTFRGKNAFGGVVPNWIMAKTDLDGNVIEVIAQGP